MNVPTATLKSTSPPSSGRGKQSLRLWLRLLSCESIIEQYIRTRLREEFSITLPQFDVLAELQHVGTPLTMTALSKQLMVSNGNVTGVIDRLVRDGLVKRAPSRSDRRVQMISLTDAGRQTFKEMALKHEQWISDLFDFLPMKDMYALIETLSRAHEALKKLQEAASRT